MRLLKKSIVNKNAAGMIKLSPTESEDIYYMYNLINMEDNVTSSTIRAVTRESATGSTSKTKIKMMITIKVEAITFDADECALRVKGRCCEENEHVKMGQYHTIDIEVGNTVTIKKECWDMYHLELIKESTDPLKGADIAAVVMQDGLANVCLIGTCMTLVKAKIAKSLPKKRISQQVYNKARDRFFDDIYNAIQTYVDFDRIKALVIASPGFVKDDFLHYIQEISVKKANSFYNRHKAKVLVIHTSSGHKKSLDEVLNNSDIISQLSDVKAADEINALARFHSTIATREDWTCYSYEQCYWADDQNIIDELLITDALFKAVDINERKKYVALVESVQSHGGKVYIFSSMHVSGEQLTLYTGIAAVLRVPVCVDDMLDALKPTVQDNDENDDDFDINRMRVGFE